MIRTRTILAGGVMPGSYSDRTLKTLFMLAGQYCAFPGCTTATYRISADTADVVILGEIAHIRSSSNAGPRADPDLPQAMRDDYTNLIVLCAHHHSLVDRLDAEYTVDQLLGWKAAAERAVSERLAIGQASVSFTELQMICTAFEAGVMQPSTGMVAVPPEEKMEANGLTDAVRAQMTTGLALTPMVADYIRRQAQIDPGFPGRLRAGFVSEYDVMMNEGVRGDELFLQLLHYGASSATTPQSTFDRLLVLHTAALAVLCHLFQICDVFETPA
jgi:hypothetical protein